MNRVRVVDVIDILPVERIQQIPLIDTSGENDGTYLKYTWTGWHPYCGDIRCPWSGDLQQESWYFEIDLIELLGLGG